MSRFHESKTPKFDPKDRTDDQILDDLVLYLLICFEEKGKTIISLEKLHEVFELFITLLAERGIIVEGCYKDIVSERYRALDTIIMHFAGSGIVHPERGDNFHLSITKRFSRKMLEEGVPEEVAAVKLVTSAVLDKYRGYSVSKEPTLRKTSEVADFNMGGIPVLKQRQDESDESFASRLYDALHGKNDLPRC